MSRTASAPEYTTIGKTLTVTFKREDAQKTAQKTAQKIISMISDNQYITTSKLAEKMNMSRRGIAYIIKEMQKEGVIHRIGPDKGGYWEVKNNNNN